MIRNAITVILAIGAVGAGALWGASYWVQPRWEYGDRLLEDRRYWITLAVSHDKYVLRAERRAEWRLTDTHEHWFAHDDAVPRNALIPGVRFEIVHFKRFPNPESPHLVAHPREEKLYEDERGTAWRVVFLQYEAPSSILILWVSPWVPVVLLGVYPCFTLTRASVRRHLRRRRGRRGLCVTCGYNLVGNVSGICPECGTPTGT